MVTKEDVDKAKADYEAAVVDTAAEPAECRKRTELAVRVEIGSHWSLERLKLPLCQLS